MALSADEQNFLATLRNNRNNRTATARELNWHERTVRRWIERLVAAGKVNADDMICGHFVGAGREIYDVTTRLNSRTGEVVQQTVRERTQGDPDRLTDTTGWTTTKITQDVRDGKVVREWPRLEPPSAADDMHLRIAERIAAIQPQERASLQNATMHTSANRLANLYVLSDAHIGMLAWHKEGGADWDLRIAEQMLVKAFAAMIEHSPPAGKAIVTLLGDWMHYDGLLSITPTSGHIVDADSRPGKMVDIAIDIACDIVQMALARHERVELLVAEGNHDLYGTVWLRKMFAKLYANEDRLHVIDHELPYYSIRHENVFLGFHHGHLKGVKNPSDMIALFSQECADHWGDKSTKRYIHTGDKHFAYEDGSKGTPIIQHPTLAARDAYASRHGFQSMREARSMTFHGEYGRTGTKTVSPEMLIAS